MQLRQFALLALASVAIPAFGVTRATSTGTYDFVFSSLTHAGGAIAVADLNETVVSEPLTLGEATFDKAIDFSDGSPIGSGVQGLRRIAYVPAQVTVKSVGVAFTQGSTAPAMLTLTVGDAPTTFELAAGSETVTLHGAAGTRTAVVHTYAAASGPVLADASAAFSLAFPEDAVGGGQQVNNLFTCDGKPFVRVVGSALIHHYVLEVSDGVDTETHGQALSTLLADTDFADDANHVVVIEFSGEGGGVKIDSALQKAPLIFGSAVPAAQAHLHFDGTGGTPIRAPMTFRDGASAGGVSLYGPSYAETSALSVWDPKALLVLCDVTLRSPLPYDVDQPGAGWFQNNTITIPAGRTFRLELPAGTSENQLPNLAFADATSVLELASANGGAGIPEKYEDALWTQSGTLVIDRDMTLEGGLDLVGSGANTLNLVVEAGRACTIGGGLLLSGHAATTLTVRGTLAVSGTLGLNATDARLDVAAGGAVSAATLSGLIDGTLTNVSVLGGLTLAEGLAAGNEADSGVLNLTVGAGGTLATGGDLGFTPARRRTLTLAGGTLRASAAATVDGGEGGADSEQFVQILGGGAIEGPVTIPAVTGSGWLADGSMGVLTLGAKATLGRIHDYVGDIEGTGAIRQITGSLGDVSLGGDWHTRIGELIFTVAKDFRGTLGFTDGAAGAEKTVDISAVNDLLSLPGAFRVNNRQHIVIRIDQFADATFRWPAAPEGITLTLIESGAYGGELTIPAIPRDDIAFELASFTDEGGYAVRPEGDYVYRPDEDGVTAELTWDDPVFTGKGAWIDVEFNGTTANTGWFTLGDYAGNPSVTDEQKRLYNGLLGGDRVYGTGSGDDAVDVYEVLTQGKTVDNWDGPDYTVNFVRSSNPYQEQGSLPLWYRPFVALASLEYPEAWTVALRLSAPNAANTCLLALGHNDVDDKSPDADLETYALVFATGDDANEICLWVFPGKGDAANVAPAEPAFRVRLADATSAQHTFCVISDGTTLALYVDGSRLGEHTLPVGRLANGLQVGTQMGGDSVEKDLPNLYALAKDAGRGAGGAIDFLRFYKGAMPESAMRKLAETAPAVVAGTRFVRTLASATETWVQAGAWTKQVFSRPENGTAGWVDAGAADEPDEGVECRVYVPDGEHALQVNVTKHGDFPSADRAYSTLVVAPAEGNAGEATLRIVPCGVTAKETDAGWEEAVTASAWQTGPGTYGAIRFTGGNADAVSTQDASLTGAAYVLSAPSRDENTTVTTTWGDEVEHQEGTASLIYPYGWYEQTGTRTTTTAWDNLSAAAQPINLIVDAGVCAFSPASEVGLHANSAGSITTVEHLYRTGTYETNWRIQRDYTPDADGERVTASETTAANETYGTQMSTLTVIAGPTLARGSTRESQTFRLSGPVVVKGTPAEGSGVLGNPGVTGEGQTSTHVWVPAFAGGRWLFTEAPDSSLDAGLAAIGRLAAGRLYLLLGPGDDETASAAAWHRYGYADAETTESGLLPIPAGEGDYAAADAFQIRLSGDAALDLDALPASGAVQTFFVERAEGTEGTPTLTLTISTQNAEGNPYLCVEREVIVAGVRLDVSNGRTGNKTDGNTLRVTRADGTHSPIHKGNQEGGAYISGPGVIDWDFGAENSIPRLEVVPGAELIFTVGQNFRVHGTTLVAQGRTDVEEPVVGPPTPESMAAGAWIHYASPDPFLGADVELGEGAYFGFHADAASADADIQEEGVILEGELRLTGNATLRADHAHGVPLDGAARIPHFVAAGGIRATKPGLTLTVDAPSHQVADGQQGSVDWHSHTSALTGKEDFRLWKTGPGTVTFYTLEPPSVSGKVTVEEGTLAVSGAPDTPIGSKGLEVWAGATLGDSGRAAGTGTGSHRLAAIPAGQTLAGGGTIGGWVRLERGAKLVAKDGDTLTVTGGVSADASGEADITVDLTDYTVGEGQRAQPYLVVNREERDLRARLLPMKGEARWDSVAWLQTREDGTVTTSHAARAPQFPAPQDYEGGEDNAINAYIAPFFISQYQAKGHAYVGATHGRTRGDEVLSGSAISEALLCFGNISAFVDTDERAEADGRTYIGGANFYVAYEFGVSDVAMAEVAGEPCLVVGVAVEATLEEAFPDVAFNGEQKAFKASYNAGTTLALGLVRADGTVEPLPEKVTVTEVTGPDGLAEGTAATPEAPGLRWFRVPYADLSEAAQADDGVIRLTATAEYAPAAQ